MIEIHNERIKDIPFLHVVEDQYYEQARPTIFFIHGFTSAKEHNLHFAYLLAEEGFRVILPDVALHGDRNSGQSNKEIMFQFWKIVVQTIGELDVLKNELVKENLTDPEKIGMVGTSMGGIITFGALTQYKWIQAAVTLMGSPNYEDLARVQIDQLVKAGVTLPFTEEQLEQEYANLRSYDLSLNAEKLACRPLLIWHGKEDPVVPFQPTYTFYENHKDDYKKEPENIRFIADEKAGHKVSREALLATVDWFTSHLAVPTVKI